MDKFSQRPVSSSQWRPRGTRVDYDHRATVNLLAVIAIMLLAAVLYWTVSHITESRKLERCIGSGRRDCFVVPESNPRIIAPHRQSF